MDQVEKIRVESNFTHRVIEHFQSLKQTNPQHWRQQVANEIRDPNVMTQIIDELGIQNQIEPGRARTLLIACAHGIT